MSTFALDAPAKINLYLHVTGRRADGYHLLDSLIVFAGVGDRLAATAADKLTLSIEGPFAGALAADEDNLVLKAARAMGSTKGARLVLEKNLPVASGIGGGSADAAATLKALIELWKLTPSRAELDATASRLGADVPICLHGRPAYIGGIGEIIDPAPNLPRAFLVLANPGVALSTPTVFKAFKGPLTAAQRFDRTPKDAAALADMLKFRNNDLTDAAISAAPEVGTALSKLAKLPHALLSRMSGSGATCFALFAQMAEAEAGAKQLAAEHPGWWVRAAELLA